MKGLRRVRGPLAGDLVGVRADVERQQALARQRAAHRVDRGMGGEGVGGWPQRGVESAAVLGQRIVRPALLLAGRAASRASEPSRSPVTSCATFTDGATSTFSMST